MRAGVLIGVLVALLGFAIAVQVRSNSSSDSLSGAREEDLIRILDDQNLQAARLRQQIADLQLTVSQLQAGGDRNSVALQQAEQQLAALGVLLGTLPATGPGVVVTVTDPARKLQPEDLLDIVQELRGAGAEAIQFGGVRVGVSTSFTAAPSGVQVDDTVEQPPYVVRAIGDPKTLDTALNIPGGVAATARAAGGDAAVAEMQRVTITALRQLPNPKYASPIRPSTRVVWFEGTLPAARRGVLGVRHLRRNPVPEAGRRRPRSRNTCRSVAGSSAGACRSAGASRRPSRCQSFPPSARS